MRGDVLEKFRRGRAPFEVATQLILAVRDR